VCREPVLRAAHRRDWRDLDRKRHAEHRHVGRLGESGANEFGRRPDFLEAIEGVGKAGRHLGELPERPQDVGAAGEGGRPERAHGDIGADQPITEKIGAGAETRALVRRQAPILEPRRGVSVEAEQREGHAGRLQRPRGAAQGFTNAGLSGRMADAGDACGEALGRHDFGVLAERRGHGGTVPADPHQRGHHAGALLDADMLVERTKQRRREAQQAIDLPCRAPRDNSWKRLPHRHSSTLTLPAG